MDAPVSSQNLANAFEFPEDFLTPEQRLKIVADVLSDIALRLAIENHVKE